MPDTQDAPLPGQGAPNTTEKAAQSALASSSEPFFEDVLPDGTKKVYSNKDELAKEWKQSYLRQSDYTRKTQEIAKTKQQIEADRKKFSEEQKAFTDAKKRYDEWDKLLKTRPDIYSQLERAATSPPDPSVAYERAKEYADGTSKELQARLEALEQRLEKEANEKELRSHMDTLKGKYEDFDENEVMTRLEYLSDGATDKLLDILYWATKGQKSPAQIEQKITDNLRKKSQASMVPSKGTGPATSRGKYTSTDIAKEAAIQELGITPNSS